MRLWEGGVVQSVARKCRDVRAGLVEQNRVREEPEVERRVVEFLDVEAEVIYEDEGEVGSEGEELGGGGWRRRWT